MTAVQRTGTRECRLSDFEDIISRVEQTAGGNLPTGYREWLRTYRPSDDDHRQIPFDVAELVETQRIVQDVIPAGTLAIGNDGYGNLVLLRFADGSIEWWSHEHLDGNHETKTIRPSFPEYLELIAQGEV